MNKYSEFEKRILSEVEKMTPPSDSKATNKIVELCLERARAVRAFNNFTASNKTNGDRAKDRRLMSEFSRLRSQINMVETKAERLIFNHSQLRSILSKSLSAVKSLTTGVKGYHERTSGFKLSGNTVQFVKLSQQEYDSALSSISIFVNTAPEKLSYGVIGLLGNADVKIKPNAELEEIWNRIIKMKEQ